MLLDPLTGDRTLLGATRDARPNEYRGGPSSRCPFCPGHEDETPPEIASVRDETGAWAARVFPNKFPAVSPPHGEHEVIVDSPLHDREITTFGMLLWRARYRAALERTPGAIPVLFKNRGADAGATIVHPHTQMIVVHGDVPRLAAMRAAGEAYYELERRCAWCDEIRAAAASGLVLREIEDAVLYVRPSSRFGAAVTVAPRRCHVSLERASESEWLAAGLALEAAVRALLNDDADPAFNVLVNSDPRAAAGTMHWNLELVPRSTPLAGFELASGMYIKGSDAQESADLWRRMLAVLDGPF